MHYLGIGATAIETSSKTGENIKELFQLIVDDFASDPNNSNLLTEATPSSKINSYHIIVI